MKYRCNQCDIVFETAASEKTRCPECMGIHHLDPVQTPSERTKQDYRRILIPVSIVLVTLGFVLVYFQIVKEPSSPSRLSALTDPEKLRAHLESSGLNPVDTVIPFEVTESIRNTATSVLSNVSSDNALESLYDYLIQKRQEGKWTPAAQDQPVPMMPLTADSLLQKLTDESTTPYSATSYELSNLLYALALSSKITGIHMLRIDHYSRQEKPADPSLIYGRFAIGQRSSSGDIEKLYDVWVNHTTETADSAMQILSPEEITAIWYGHRSLFHLAEMNLPAALDDNEIAIRISPDIHLLRIHKGRIFLLSGAIQDALAEFEQARRLTDHETIRVAITQLSLLSGEHSPAVEAGVREVLSTFPMYHQARILLAGIHMMRGDMESAWQELEIANSHAPTSPEVAQAMAQFHLAGQDVESAIREARKAVRLSKESLPSLMMLAQIYMATARFDEMRQTARQMLEMTSSSEMKEQIRQMFRITADSPETVASTTEEGPSPESTPPISLPEFSSGDFKLKLETETAAPRRDGLRLGNTELQRNQ